MRIKWNSNFQIEDATVQLAEAYIHVTKFENIDDTCQVQYDITDASGSNVVKSVITIYDRNFSNEISVYNYLLSEFNQSEIVET